jgi:hypothetical protein
MPPMFVVVNNKPYTSLLPTGNPCVERTHEYDGRSSGPGNPLVAVASLPFRPQPWGRRRGQTF